MSVLTPKQASRDEYQNVYGNPAAGSAIGLDPRVSNFMKFELVTLRWQDGSKRQVLLLFIGFEDAVKGRRERFNSIGLPQEPVNATGRVK